MVGQIAYASVKSEDLMKVCLTAIKSGDIKGIIGRKRPADAVTVNKNFIDPHGLQGSHFKSGADITLRITESLALAYLARYYQHNTNRDVEYVVHVDIDDNFKRDKELYLSDGVLAVVDNKTEKVTKFSPFQQVIAQNIVGNNTPFDIQEIIIQEMKKKIAKRSNYNDISGLIVSVFPSYGSKINLDEIIKECDVESFTPTFLLVYSNDFETCQIMHINKALATKGEELQRVQNQSLIIHANPQHPT